MIHTNNLFQEFDAVSTEDWVLAIEKHLKGQPINSLNLELEEGLFISPIHRQNDTTTQYLGSARFASNNNWNICEEINVHSNDYAQANKTILHGLEKGANSLIIELQELPSTTDLETLLQGVLLDLIPLHFKGAALLTSPNSFIKNLVQLPSSTTIQGSCDLGNLSKDQLIDCLSLSLDTIPNLRLITISIGNASTQNLSQAIYKASKWMDILLKNGKTIEQIAHCLRFEFNVSDHYFLELSTIRAFKKLWLGLLEAYGADEAVPPLLHATTKSDQNTDQYWNMITATTQTMAAALAGVDSIYICPSNGKTEANDFTRRIARNVQHILQSESYLNRVIDPAAGSYYIEHLTAALAKKAWQQFCNL